MFKKWMFHYYSDKWEGGWKKCISHRTRNKYCLFTVAPFFFKLAIFWLGVFLEAWSMIINQVEFRNPMPNSEQRHILDVYNYSMPYRYVRHKRFISLKFDQDWGIYEKLIQAIIYWIYKLTCFLVVESWKTLSSSEAVMYTMFVWA